MKKTMVRRCPASTDQSGMSLVSVVMGLGLAGILSLAVSKILVDSIHGQNRFSLRNDLELLKMSIAQYIDCPNTFSAAGIDIYEPKSSCGSTSADNGQKAPYLRLRRKTALEDCKDPSSKVPDACWLTPKLDKNGVGSFGSWKLRVSCSSKEQTLVVRTARLDNKGAPMKDPLTGEVLDWKWSKSLMFGMAANLFMCFGSEAASGGSTLIDVGYAKVGQKTFDKSVSVLKILRVPGSKTNTSKGLGIDNQVPHNFEKVTFLRTGPTEFKIGGDIGRGSKRDKLTPSLPYTVECHPTTASVAIVSMTSSGQLQLRGSEQFACGYEAYK